MNATPMSQALEPRSGLSPDAMKTISLVVLVIESACAASIAICLPQCQSNKKTISYANCFAGGIFLVAGVVHMLGEGTKAMHEEYESSTIENLSPNLITVIIGWWITLLLERGIFPHSPLDGEVCRPPASPHDGEPVGELRETGLAGVSAVNRETPQVLPPDAPPCSNEEPESMRSAERSDAHKHSGGPLHSPMATIAILIALSAHCLIEGIALGLQKTSEGVLLLLVAIAAHKWAEDFAVAASSRGVFSKRNRIVLSVCQASANPLGIAVGWILGANLSPLVTAYVLCFCCGTFLNMACTEVAATEMPERKRSFKKLVVFLVGIAVMYAIIAILKTR